MVRSEIGAHHNSRYFDEKVGFRSKSPRPVPEHGDGAAVAAVRRDSQIRRADHEILMDHGVVHAERAHLLERAVRVVADGVDKAHAEREVAAGIFVKQGVVKQDACLVDGAVIRHERALAEVGRAFVHGDELLQQGLIRARVRLDGAAVLEADGKASSVNMATLSYKTWQQEGAFLILSGKSVGNHQVLPFSDTLHIEKLTQDSLILKKGELILRYAKEDTISQKKLNENIPASLIAPAKKH